MVLLKLVCFTTSTVRGAVGSLVVRALDSKPDGLGSNLYAGIVEVEIGGFAIYRPFGEFHQAKSYCHLYGAQGQRPAYL
ncbi:hypothetical protein TNCV_1396201 [Trichonephila clavipes]|nr:hypothetical protein TNCV_1396201 [Trichonephila clavipes]